MMEDCVSHIGICGFVSHWCFEHIGHQGSWMDHHEREGIVSKSVVELCDDLRANGYTIADAEQAMDGFGHLKGFVWKKYQAGFNRGV